MRACALFVMLSVSCTTTQPATRPIDVADRLFVRGDYEAAVASYAAAADGEQDSNAELRARFFALIARRAATGPEQEESVLEALRAFAAEASSSPWGRIAAHYADEMTQADALRRAVLAAGAELAARDARLAELTRTIEEYRGIVDERDKVIAALKEERTALARLVKELEELLSSRAASIVALENELEALKRIDLSRTP